MANKFIIYLLLISILATSSISMWHVIKHYDLYANDPLVYGAKVKNLSSCTCITSDSGTLNFDQDKVTIIKTSTATKPIYGVINFTLQK